MKRAHIWILLALFFSTGAYSQKVKVGYDKGVDFSHYATYTWATPATPPARPLLYLSIIDSIDYELKSKGLVRKEDAGDLTLVLAGGLEFGFNNAAGTPAMPYFSGPPPAIDSTMWTGAGGFSNLTASQVPEGTLLLNLVDRGANKVVWSGSVKQKFDLDNKKKSIELLNQAISKLLKGFPPKKP